jgi:hypothetical protein
MKAAAMMPVAAPAMNSAMRVISPSVSRVVEPRELAAHC